MPMLRHRHKVLIRPELDDEPLHRTITMTRPVRRMHGLGAERGPAAWAPVADLLRETGPVVFRRLGCHMTPFPWDTTADPLGTFTFWSARARR